MALPEDLNAISIASSRAIEILKLANKTFVFSNDDGLQDDDTRITLTAGQKAALQVKIAPLITIIKNRAALLP